MSRVSTFALALMAAGALSVSGCKKPVEQPKPVLKLTVHDNAARPDAAAKQDTVVAAGNKAAPFALGPKYDVTLTVTATAAAGGVGELDVGVVHSAVMCSVKPGGPKSDKPANYAIDQQQVTGGASQAELSYQKAIKAAEQEERTCQTIHAGGMVLYPTVDPGGLIQVHASARNGDGSQTAEADWYLKRPG
jgi:hypothetical protein